MFCRNCGRELEDGTRFCPSCGTPVQKDDLLHQDYETQDVHDRFRKRFDNEYEEGSHRDFQYNDQDDRFENESEETSQQDAQCDSQDPSQQDSDPYEYLEGQAKDEIAASLAMGSYSSYPERLFPNHTTSATESMVTQNENSRSHHRSKRLLRKLWVIPVVAAVLAIGSVGGVAAYEQHRTQEALAAYHQGETYALQGDYQKAAVAFKQSLKLRNNFKSAQLDLQVATLGQATAQNVALATSLEKKGKYDQSLSTIQQAESHLANYKGPLITTLSASLSKARVVASVAQLRDEMKGKTSIADLAPILQKAENLNFPEAKQIADQIRKQIAEVSYKAATAQLDQNNFSEATAAITEGLKYAPSNNKLISLKTTVAQKQKAFENAQQAKMAQAMVAAAKEKANNKTNAVQLVDLSTSWDPYGDLVVTGTIKSIATVPISSVLVSYTLTDSSGNVVDSGQVYANTDQLYPGDTTTFTDTDYGLQNRMSDPMATVTATVTGATWYLSN